MPHIAIIEARFYTDIADAMLSAAETVLNQAGATYDIISIPGCFEIPAALSMAHAAQGYDGYIALGCVIQGQTSHFDYVCSESARGINQLAVDHKLAVGYGIITAQTNEQANARSADNDKNFGHKAACCCLDMIKTKMTLINHQPSTTDYEIQ